MQRRFRISGVLAVAISAFFFLSATVLTQAAQKKSNLLGGAHGMLHLASGDPVEGVGVQLIVGSPSKTNIRTTVYSHERRQIRIPPPPRFSKRRNTHLRIPSPREFQAFRQGGRPDPAERPRSWTISSSNASAPRNVFLRRLKRCPS